MAVVFCFFTTVFFTTKHNSITFGHVNDPMQTVYARARGGGSQQRHVADGADVVFTSTVYNYILIRLQLIIDKLVISSVSITVITYSKWLADRQAVG